ncbi:unnamed protein product [Adineta steineri]|uniref:Fungal lipase-type domain-containing protein n=3 Tax=Adineta steineri TaxID=433720 RepID=A0A818WEH4_9BILA|nr:unnamed protein product [Adineta steineri]CAF3724287.1 unnamed protein product [Adineta steineri]
MSDQQPMSVSEPLNGEIINIDDSTNVNRSKSPSSFNRIIRIFFYLFSDCLFARILAFTFICQAAVMWLGTALNFILQLLFIPFSFSASSKPDELSSSNIFSFLGSYSMIPGIVAFSAHYFWFVLQIGCHCFTTTLRNKKSDHRTNALLFFIDNEILFFHINVKQLYRLFVSLSSIGYIIYYASRDLLNCLIVPSGQVPLALMWGLHVLHLLGLAIYVGLTVYSNWTKTSKAMKPLKFHPTSNLSGLIIISMLIIIPIVFQCIGIFVNVLIGILAFIIWTFVFHQTWVPAAVQDQDNEPPPAHEDTNDRTRPETVSSTIRLNDTKHFYCVNICSVFFKGPLDRYYDSEIITRLTRVFTYKVFILVLQCIMLTSLVFVLQRSFNDLSFKERVFQICLLILLASVELILLLPPFIARFNILRIQMNLIQILLICIFILLIIGIIVLIRSKVGNQLIMAICILPPFIYAILLFIFYVYHIIRDVWHLVIKKHRNQRNLLVPGLIEWIECHHSISLYVNAYYMIFLILALIAFAGLTLASSMFYLNNKEVEKSSNFQDTTSLYGNDTLKIDRNSDRMEACNWHFEDFTIEDMILFAALAYQPTDLLQNEINHFYPIESNQTKTMFIDIQNSQFQAHGYGNVTYFTLVTKNAVVVSIRGTKLLYEWLIDFDTWNEAFLYQILSILFPWSKLFPEYMTARIIKHLSILERLVNVNLKQFNKKRFYLQQIVPKLRRIRQLYRHKRSFILVGHSLGGGLAKLAGAALLNETSVVVSVSGPGITYSHAKMDETKNIPMADIHKKIFNIYHDRDVVSWSDKQEGLQQAITCPSKYNFLQCHYINPFMCAVIQQCGNTKQFKFNKSVCEP